MIENQVHTPDSPLHPDAFAHMVGTVRTDPATGLKYTVTRVLFKGASRFHAASVTVQGEIIESAPRPGHPNATMLGAFAAEGFYSNPPVPVEPMPVMIENQTDTPRVLTDSDINACHVGSTVTVVADASPYDGVKAVSYTGTLVKVTDTRAYVRREGCKTARPFVRGPRFRYLLHADV